MIVVIATRNRGKVREIIEAFGAAGIEWRTLDDYPPVPEPEETGVTFAENAALKARYYAAHTRAMTLAEDSGLEVAALDGRPGVYSARFAGDPCDDDANNAKVLAELAAVPPAARGARFVSCFAVAAPGEEPRTVRGEVAGTIADACAGTHGFGYDAVFIPDGYDHTFGVLDPGIKRRISHRARALAQLIPLLRDAGAAAKPA